MFGKIHWENDKRLDKAPLAHMENLGREGIRYLIQSIAPVLPVIHTFHFNPGEVQIVWDNKMGDYSNETNNGELILGENGVIIIWDKDGNIHQINNNIPVKLCNPVEKNEIRTLYLNILQTSQYDADNTNDNIQIDKYEYIIVDNMLNDKSGLAIGSLFGEMYLPMQSIEVESNSIHWFTLPLLTMQSMPIVGVLSNEDKPEYYNLENKIRQKIDAMELNDNHILRLIYLDLYKNNLSMNEFTNKIVTLLLSYSEKIEPAFSYALQNSQFPIDTIEWLDSLNCARLGETTWRFVTSLEEADQNANQTIFIQAKDISIPNNIRTKLSFSTRRPAANLFTVQWSNYQDVEWRSLPLIANTNLTVTGEQLKQGIYLRFDQRQLPILENDLIEYRLSQNA